MQVSSWKCASCGGSALEMFERELGQVFSCPTTLSSKLGQRGSTPRDRLVRHDVHMPPGDPPSAPDGRT